MTVHKLPKLQNYRYTIFIIDLDLYLLSFITLLIFITVKPIFLLHNFL